MRYLTYYRETSSGKTARWSTTKVLVQKKGRRKPAVFWLGGGDERIRRPTLPFLVKQRRGIAQLGGEKPSACYRLRAKHGNRTTDTIKASTERLGVVDSKVAKLGGAPSGIDCGR